MTRVHQTSRVGEQVGDYRLIRFIGAGGMGEVYEAEHVASGERQAIKFLRRDLVSRSDLIARFEREARIAGTLQSRHIIRVHHFCLGNDGMPYMVMDLAEGRSLASLLAEQGRLTVTRAVDLAHQACEGLRVAHEAKIVHRDLKPENLYVCPEADGAESLRILDFGIAKLLDAGDFGPTTETGTNLGTAHYMSPEQAQGAQRAIDHRTDLYSLGVILYELLSGRKPHEGQSYNEVLIRIVTQKPAPLDTFCPTVPTQLVSLVHRAMAKEPVARFQSALEFADALARCRSAGIEPAGAAIALQPATRPRSSDMATLASDPENRPGRSRRLRLFLSIVAALAAMTALFALSGWPRHTRVSPTGYPALPTSLPTATSAAAKPSPTSQTVATEPESATHRPQASAKSSGATSVPGRHAAQSQAPRPPQSTLPRNVTAFPPTPVQGSVTKPPTIDEPLPPSPHAPGVSPVME